jgi:hypothetical protein
MNISRLGAESAKILNLYLLSLRAKRGNLKHAAKDCHVAIAPRNDRLNSNYKTHFALSAP